VSLYVEQCWEHLQARRAELFNAQARFDAAARHYAKARHMSDPPPRPLALWLAIPAKVYKSRRNHDAGGHRPTVPVQQVEVAFRQ
jgi:hypothetical protein